MTSFTSKKLPYVSFLSGLVLGILIPIATNFLRPLDNPGVTIFTQLLIIIALGAVAGLILKNKPANSYIVSIFALLYTYAISIAITVFTSSIHYALSAFISALIALGLFYLSDRFFNHLKLSMQIKLLIAVIGSAVLFVVCSYVGLYILRNIMTDIY